MIIDLSLPIKNSTPGPDSPKIKYFNHIEGAKNLAMAASNIFKTKITEKDFSDSMGLANEEMILDTHSGTHLDAPWHFTPQVNDKKALTIDEIPLEWCYNDGVVLDFRYKQAGDAISQEDVQKAVDKIKYKIKAYDIVLIMTGADKYFEKDNYFSAYPGMSAEATEYILEQGVKIIGIDAWGFDRPAVNMLQDFLKTKDNTCIFPAHFVGKKIEYCHIEKLANLDNIPKPFGFKIVCFPVKIEKASAGWCRVVAII